MANTPSKIRVLCLAAIRKTPGMPRYQLYKMGIGHKSTIRILLSRLVYDGAIVRIWDDAVNSWRLYPKGKEPVAHTQKEYKQNLYPSLALYFKDIANPDIGEGHGEKFRMAFDVAFGILYIDLKMIAGGCCQ